MLTKVRIKAILKKYFLRVRKAGSGIDKKPDHAVLHDFRVGYKKLRSFLRLLAIETNSPREMELPDRFKKMNKILGRVFDEQLCRKRLIQAVGNKGYFPKQQHIKYNDIRHLLLSDQEMNKIEEDINEKLPSHLSDHSVRVFFTEKKKKARQIVRSGSWSDKDLHSIRKLQKDMVNISKLWNELKISSRYIFKKGRSLNKAEAVSDALGHLNDCTTAIGILSPAIINQSPKEYQQPLRQARRKWLADKRKMKQQIIAALTKRFQPDLATSD